MIINTLWILLTSFANCTSISAFPIVYIYVCSLNFPYNILLISSLTNELKKVFDNHFVCINYFTL